MTSTTDMTSSVIDDSRRFDLDHTPWAVKRLTDFYTGPTGEHPDGDGRLYLPPHQRNWSWTGVKGVKKMQTLIDSILHNYPVPTIILNSRDSGDRDRWEIYDGRHRIETLWRFVTNKFPIPVNGVKVYYKDLSDTDKRRFLETKIPVVTTSNASPAQLAEVFIRLNSGKPLTQVDYCWASRESPLIRGVMEILSRWKDRFEVVFGGVDITDRKSLPNWVESLLVS